MNTTTQSPATHTPTITASIGSTGASFHYNNVASHPLSFRIEYRSPELSEEGQQLAAFIVRACNSHAQLVAALENLVTEAIHFRGTCIDAKHLNAALDSANSALQAAKE